MNQSENGFGSPIACLHPQSFLQPSLTLPIIYLINSENSQIFDQISDKHKQTSLFKRLFEAIMPEILLFVLVNDMGVFI